MVTIYFQGRERSDDAEGNAILGELGALALYLYEFSLHVRGEHFQWQWDPASK